MLRKKKLCPSCYSLHHIKKNPTAFNTVLYSLARFLFYEKKVQYLGLTLKQVEHSFSHKCVLLWLNY